MSEQPQKQPKSILKKSKQSQPPVVSTTTSSSQLSQQQQQQQQPITSNNNNHHPSTEVVWDEANLQLNEEERIAAGPRMKIDEPKTPYHESIHPDHDDLADDFSLGPSIATTTNAATIQQNNNNIQNDPQYQQQQQLQQQQQHNQPNLSHLAHQNMIQNAIMLTDNLIEESSSEEEDDRYDGMSDKERDEEIEKHKKFEEMRKNHYKMKADVFKKNTNPLSQRYNPNNDDNDSDDDSDSDYKE